MIDELRIRNLGVIAEASLPLGPGFTAVTGETGAGKTMVVTALGLVLGERGDAGAVRTGADQVEIDARVLVRGATLQRVSPLVGDVGGRIDDGELLLNRTVSSEGRSRATVGGRPAPVGTLAEIAEHIVTVHGQSEQMRLRSVTAQREALDRFAGPSFSSVLASFQYAFERARDMERQLRDVTSHREAREREAEVLRADLREIEAVNPAPGEDIELALRLERLSNTESLRLAAASAHEALSSEALDGTDVLGLFETARRALERASDPALTSVVTQLGELSLNVNEIAGVLAGFLANLDDVGPAELDILNERRAALASLVRKHSGIDGGLDGVLAFVDSASKRLLEIDTSDEHVERLREELRAARTRVWSLAGELSSARRVAASELSAAVTEELHALAMPDARLVADVQSVPSASIDEPLPAGLTESGADTVTLLLAPHPGSDPRPIAKTASGGELSRVMLAIEVVISAADPVPTFVFDEVDAGVGGAAAIEIGRRLAKLAEHSQVIVVTHLAQVAAFADNHVRVHKANDGVVTTSSIQRLMGAEREAEMARLLSGLSDSESALQHARELLELGR